jgi:hypothetical protein
MRTTSRFRAGWDFPPVSDESLNDFNLTGIPPPHARQQFRHKTPQISTADRESTPRRGTVSATITNAHDCVSAWLALDSA